MGRFLGAARLERRGGPRATRRGDQAAGAEIATALRHAPRALRCTLRSRQLAPERELDFIPGKREWADFDPTATANAIYLLDVPEALDRAAVERTFDKYLADWRAKRSGAVPPGRTTRRMKSASSARWCGLGRRDAALELLRFFLSDRRPQPWNQWPEIAWRDRKAPAHVGDLPHTWISAEYVLAVRSLFAYEREADRALVLGAGLAPEWIDGAGVRVSAMPTLYGALSYSLRRLDDGTVRCESAPAYARRWIILRAAARMRRCAARESTVSPRPTSTASRWSSAIPLRRSSSPPSRPGARR